MQPNVLEDEVITGIARHLQRTPAQVLLAWAVQRGVAFLTTSATLSHIRENLDITTLPHRAMLEIRE
ncbi:2,5-diketo-D-gluconate reductase B [compost metagenome]